MSTSESSDSEPEPDLDLDYGRVSGENPGGSDAINRGASQDPNAEVLKLIEKSVENSTTNPRVKVEGPGNVIDIGTKIIIHPPREPSSPSDDILKNIEETKRLEKIVGGIRDYYHTVRNTYQRLGC